MGGGGAGGSGGLGRRWGGDGDIRADGGGDDGSDVTDGDGCGEGVVAAAAAVMR